jgi:hypothetical protein
MKNIVLAAFAALTLTAAIAPVAASAATFNSNSYQSGYDASHNNPGQVTFEGADD